MLILVPMLRITSPNSRMLEHVMALLKQLDYLRLRIGDKGRLDHLKSLRKDDTPGKSSKQECLPSADKKTYLPKKKKKVQI
jgi:hypothetical protein